MNYDELGQIYNQQYDSYRDDLHFYASVTERVNGEVLEIGAGTGRVTAFLARRGVQMVGVEPSRVMRDGAQKRAQETGVSYQLIEGDAQTFQYRAVPMIIAPFNALMHLYTASEQWKAMQNIATHLERGGEFVFDLYVPHFGAMNTMRHEGETYHAPDGSRTDIFLVQRHDAVGQLITTEYFADTTDPNGQLTRKHYTLTQRYYSRPEMEWLLRCAGFETPKVTGSFQGGRLDERSEVMVFHTKKA